MCVCRTDLWRQTDRQRNCRNGYNNSYDEYLTRTVRSFEEPIQMRCF